VCAAPNPCIGFDHCCICLERLEIDDLGVQRLPCGHLMHKLCVTQLRRSGTSCRCPLCRQSHTDLIPVQILLQRATAHYGRREFGDAAIIWGEVLDLEPTNATAADHLAYCYFQGRGVFQNLDRAIDLYEDARRNGCANAAFKLGAVYKEKGDVAKAIACWEESRIGGDAKAANNLAKLYWEQSNTSKAMMLYEEARQGGIAEAANNLGVLYQLKHDIPKAIALYQEARQGGNAKAACNLGRLFMEKGDAATAKALWEEARLKGDAEAAFNLGAMYRVSGDLSKAMALYQEACRGGNTKAIFKLAILYEENGDVAKAQALLDQARRGALPRCGHEAGIERHQFVGQHSSCWHISA